MTENKPIMIDNIDVSECEQITCKYSKNPMCGNTGICCYGRKKCDFKQLKHSEAQLEGMFVSHTDIENKLKAVGFDVLVFIPSVEEDTSRITCGNAILSEVEND